MNAQIEKLRIKLAVYEDMIENMKVKEQNGTLPKSIKALIDSEALSITSYEDKRSSGKMYKVPAIGTICYACGRCRERMLDENTPNCVCKYCFVQSSMNLPNEMYRQTYNHDMLQSVLSENSLHKTTELAVKKATTDKKNKDGSIDKATFSVRIEHKGDTDGYIHAYNYFRLAKAIKAIDNHVNVTVWSKNIDHYADACRIFGITSKEFKSTLTLIYSAFELNQEGVNEIERIVKQYDIVKGGFVVYDIGGKVGSDSETDDINEMFVKDNFDSNLEMFACKCRSGSCGYHCNKCYNAEKRDTDGNFIAMEVKR